MRWFTTILLIVLVAGSAFWAWKGDRIAPSIGLAPEAAATTSPAVDTLAQFKPSEIKNVSLTIDQDKLTLERGADGLWTQPGNWPVRQDEATALVATLGNLKSRFQPVTPEGDLKPYGLDASQKPILVKLGTSNRTVTLTVGRPAAKPDEPEYARPTYVKVDDSPELLRFDSDVMQVVARKPEEYRRKQIFPEFERYKLTGGESFSPNQPTPPGGRWPVVSNQITAIKLETPDSGLVIKRVAPNPQPKVEKDSTSEPSLTANKLATVWELEAIGVGKSNKSYTPLRDRLDPAKLRGLLTAIPEIWVEQFLPAKPVAITGLDQPERILTVTRQTGPTTTPTTLKIGKTSRTVVKPGTPPPPAQPFAPPPPPPQPVIETYHYASIDGLDLLFEVKADRFNDLFPKPDELRDASLARYETDDVQKIEIAIKDRPPIVLTKRKGNRKAEKDDEKQDRWYVGETLAESAKVKELIEALSKLEARNPAGPVDPLIVAEPMGEKNVLDNPNPMQLTSLGLDGSNTITLTVEEKSSEGNAPGPIQVIKYLIGKHDAEKKKLNVQVAGWPRANVVPDDAKKLIDRPALAYRGRKLFDTAEQKLTGVTVTPTGGNPFTLQKTDTTWKLTKPIAIDADAAKSTQITDDLARLEATEYVDDTPKPEDLDKKYGLAKPKAIIELVFGGKTETIEIGAAPEFKSEYYARRNKSGSVFTISKTAIDALNDGALTFLPLQLWSVPSENVTSLEIARNAGQESYKLIRENTVWKLTGPFEATVPAPVASAAAAAVATIKAEKYDAATADPTRHGLDQPSLKLLVTYKQTKDGKDGDTKTEAIVSHTLLIGKPAEAPNTRYAKLADGPNNAVFILNDAILKDVDQPALERLDKTVLNLNPSTITTISIVGTKTDTNVKLSKDAMGVWTAEGATFAIDRPTLDRLLAAVARPDVQRIAAYGPSVPWAMYGLEQPELTITTTSTTDGMTKTHTLKLGRPADPKAGNAGNSARYARLDDGPAALLLTVPATEALARGKLDFADRTLLSFDAPALTAMVRKKGNEELEIVQGATVGWDMIKPGKFKADQAILDDLSEQLAKLRASRVAAFGVNDLKPFGLDAPAAIVTLKVGLDKPVDKIIRIGQPVDKAAPDGDRYVSVDGAKETTIGVLPAELARRLLADPLKFRDRALARFTKADRIEMIRGDRSVTFAEINGTWKMMKPVESEAEQADIDELINALAKLRADELEIEKPNDLKPYGLDKPTVKWTLKDGSNDVLSLLVGNEKNGRAYVKLEKGDMIGVLDRSLTAKVLGEYRKRTVWSGVDASQVETIEFTNGTASFQLTKVGANWIDSAKPTDMIDPAKISELLDAMAGLKVLRYAADQKADLKLYGLEPPQRTITISQRGGVVKTLHLGREEGGSNGTRLYAKVADKDRTDVFVLSEADTAKLARDRSALLQKK